MSTDDEWEKWGQLDPYFAVLTGEKYRRSQLTEEALIDFFESGRADLQRILKVCEEKIDKEFSPETALDFGCGTGRVLIPLARSIRHVVGLDVSDAMLKEAAKNCADALLDNVRLIKSDDELSRLEGYFDLVHSVIVFQHIATDRGRRILSRLLDHLAEGGIAVIQLTYARTEGHRNEGAVELPQQMVRNFLRYLRRRLARIRRMVSQDSQIEGNQKDPQMEMNQYNLNDIFYELQTRGVKEIYVEFTDHGGELGVYLFFRKERTRIR